MTTHRDAVDTLAAERYLLGEMSEAERHEFEAHFFTCDECADDMRLAGRLRRDAALFTEIPQPAGSPDRRVLPWRRTVMTAIPWAAAACLALVVSWQAATRPADDEARAVAATALRPASRGAVPAVALPAPDATIALALDVTSGAEGDPVAYRIEREDGSLIAEGPARLPAPGLPVLLLVPSKELRPGGLFVVKVTSGAGGVPAAEYRFNAVAN